ncbi:MAG TPA: PaaI family thioesterase [Nakamurella sp.]|jgi:uncharacterized protein (TIGR00369 family)
MTQTQMPADARSREHRWDDPAIALASLPTLSGLEFLRAMVEGRVPSPPISSTLDFADFTVEPGTVTVELDPAEFHMNPLGTVHGGVIAALLDTACGCAVHTTLPAGTGYTSLDLNTRFLRPVRAGAGRIRCVGKVLTAGSRTATAEARILDTRDRLLAHATSTCLIFPIGPSAI